MKSLKLEIQFVPREVAGDKSWDELWDEDSDKILYVVLEKKWDTLHFKLWDKVANPLRKKLKG